MPDSTPNFLFRFGSVRKGQDRMMADIYDALSEKKSIFINAPTGIGKTDAAVSACISFALERGISVFFLTPKNSQHKIVVDVLSGIRKKCGADIRYVDLVGKRNMCVNPEVNLIEGEPFYKASDQLVKNKKCPFYNNAKAVESIDDGLVEACARGHNALFSACSGRKICAYEISAKIAKQSNFIIADYAHFLNPFTMESFARKIGNSMRGSIVIWDEAHNISDIASSYLSVSLSTQSVARAAEELKAIGSAIDLGYLSYVLEKLAESKIKTAKIGEAFVEKEDVPALLLEDAERTCDQLDKAGMEYVTRSGAKRSALMHTANFIRAVSSEREATVKIVTRYPTGIKLSVSCLYPTEALASMQDAYANVFMSGTLLPLEMHRQLLGFPDARAISYPSPFPSRNRLCLIDKDVSTKYTSRTLSQFKLIAEKIAKVRESVHGNIAVFFPSFDILEAVRRHIPYEVKFVQRRGMASIGVERIIASFKEDDDNLLFAVMGGSLSEGVDYPNNVIKGILIVGIPLERPSLELTAKVDYLNRKFAMRGSEYAYLIPGVMKAVQAAGRAIRSESDRAFVVFMDKRYAWRMYRSIVADFMQIDDSVDYIGKISSFMAEPKGIRAEVV